MSKNFAITGVGGYVAPRHLKSIYETGNQVIAALDPKDSVGLLDRYSPDIDFFVEFERFDRHIEKLRRSSKPEDHIHYISICSPNYLHDAHARLALRVGADAICEKPAVLNPWNIDALLELEQESGQRIYNVLQLRYHPAILELKKKIDDQAKSGKKHQIKLTYITSRGNWYHTSWKGDVHKSGGIATNIGVHFFDMLMWIFGGMQSQEVHLLNDKQAAGFMDLKNAEVKWFLSVNKDDVPFDTSGKSQATYRSITVDDEEVEFSGGFTDLHTAVYQNILSGNGYGLETTKPAIEVVHNIRHANPIGLNVNSHPILLDKD